MSILGHFAYDLNNNSKLSEKFKENLDNVLKAKHPMDLLSQNNETIVNIVLGPEHAGILFDSGRVARIPFQTVSDEIKKTESQNNEPEPRRELFYQNDPRQVSPIEAASTYSLSRRARIHEVPETLIEQVQAVLQDRGRSTIRNELIRSNLNVNSTINSLLNTNILILDEMPRVTTKTKKEYHTNLNIETKNIESPETSKIVKIGAMFSKMLLIDNKNKLFSWKWDEKSINHIKDDVINLKCSFARAAIQMTQNRIFTMLDDSIFNGSNLEGILNFNNIQEFCVNSFYSVVLADNTLFYWGALPHDHRNKIIADKKKKSKKEEKIELGSFVTYRQPSYIPNGSLAYYCNNTIKMGRLVDSITNNRKDARFLIVNNDEKKSRKRKHSESKEEIWDLNYVVFLYEQNNEIGQVVKIDKDNVLIEVDNHRRSLSRKDLKDVCRLKNSRIMNMSELKVVKHSTKRKNLPYCLLHPKKIEYKSPVLGLQSTEHGIYILTKKETHFLEFIIPGQKTTESYKIGNLKEGNYDLNFCNEMLILKNDKNYYIYANENKNFIKFDGPIVPEFSYLKIFSKTHFRLLFYSFSHLTCLNNDLIYRSNELSKFYNFSNILHFFAYLCFISENIYDSQNFESITSKIKFDLSNLIYEKNADGLTPILYAIKIRSYKFALFLYNLIKNQNLNVINAVLNNDLPPNFNPLYLLCSNENCTYSWTKNCHTTQDIFECKTCKIVENLCLCTECVVSCHRGHDCVRKERSQSAFCDCWQQCLCQSLVSGDKTARKDLFRLFVNEMQIMSNIGSGFDHLLLFVMRSLSRQMKNFKDYKKLDKSKRDVKENTVLRDKRSQIIGVQIKHQKGPGRFLHFALKQLLSSKESLLTLFTTKEKSSDKDNESFQKIPYFFATFHLIPKQSCGKLYDTFLYTLLTKCDKNMTAILYKTLKRSFSDQPLDLSTEDNVLVNFIRSCIRLYVVITSTMAPVLLCEASKQSNSDQYRILHRLVMFLKRFPITTVTQLCKLSVSIISPIIYGSVTNKVNSHPLYTRMSDVNDYISAFFSSSQTSISNIKSKKSRSSNIVINVDRLPSQTFDLETTFTEDEDEDEEEDFSEDTEFTVYSDENFDQITDLTFSPAPNPDADFPPLIDTNADSESPIEDPVSEAEVTPNVERRRLPSPFYLHRVGTNDPVNYHWAVRSHQTAEPRSEGMAVIRAGNTDTLSEGNSLLISNQTGLARSFMICIKLISDLCVSHKIFGINDITEKLFNPTLGQVLLWLFDICERIEGKLRFGMISILNSTPNLQSGRWDYDFTQSESLNDQSRLRRRAEDRSLSLSNKNRSEFLSNLVSLMRSYNNDHDGILPYLDLSSCKHVAYLIDGFAYFLTSFNNFKEPKETFIKLGEHSLILKVNPNEHNFFHRTSSTLSFSHLAPKLNSIEESLPIAVHPTILCSSSSKKTYFSTSECDISQNPILNSSYNFSSFHLFTTQEKNKLVNDLITTNPQNYYVRWFHVFDIFAQIFADSISTEPASIFREICRYDTKESGFKSQMEKARSANSSELALDHLDRKPEKLIVQTFKTLNSSYQKRDLAKMNGVTFSRIKTSFKNEPGEGSGVTRNFFAAICDAIKNLEKLPDMTSILDINTTHTVPSTTRLVSSILPTETVFYPGFDFTDAPSNPDRLLTRLTSLASHPFTSRDRLLPEISGEPRVRVYNATTRSSNRRSLNEEISSITLVQIEKMSRDPSLVTSKQLETRLRFILKKKIIRNIAAEYIHMVLESLMQLSPDVLFSCLHDEEFLKSKVENIIKLVTGVKEKFILSDLNSSVFSENAPLFFQPGKPGFYFPVNAKKTFIRLNAYKNVGRLIGLALVFNELIPIIFCRPVIKYLLDKKISFHDFAFYDPVQYESLRMLKLEGDKLRKENADQEVPMHGLTYCLTTEGIDEKPQTVELIPGGYQINVTSHNIDNYIQTYVEFLLINCVKPELNAMRDGLNETLNTFPLKIFTPEDFRLLINGTFEISISLLKKLVTFSDESSNLGAEKVARFQQWFWETLESFNSQQKSDLLLFWTSSPILSETQSNPKPNIVIKPPSDHLPTSNTCVMRLYIPAYNKKSVLKSKILLAIKTKSFGFI